MKKIISCILCLLLVSSFSMINVSASTQSIKLSKPKINVTLKYKTLKIDSDYTVYSPRVTIKIQKVKIAKKYQIYMKINGGKWASIKTTTSRSYTKKLATNNTYYFKVKAVNNKDFSKFSNIKKLKTKLYISKNVSSNVSKNELSVFKSRYEAEKKSYLNYINSQINECTAQINSFNAKYAAAATKHSTILSNLRRQYANAGMLNSGAYQTAVKSENLRYEQEIDYYSNQAAKYEKQISDLQKLKSEEYIKAYAFEQINIKYGTSYSDMNKYYNQLY